MIDSPEQLFKRLAEKNVVLTPEREEEIRSVSRKYSMRISDYYFDLIDWSNPNCPIYRQCIPDVRELEIDDGYSDDPLNEG